MYLLHELQIQHKCLKHTSFVLSLLLVTNIEVLGPKYILKG